MHRSLQKVQSMILRTMTQEQEQPTTQPEQDEAFPNAPEGTTEALEALPQTVPEDATAKMIRDEEEGEDQDFQRCLVDFVEWWCNKIIHYDSSSQHSLKELQAGLGKALETLDLPNDDNRLPKFGRLHNRLELVALCLDVAGLPTTVSNGKDKTGEEGDNEKEKSRAEPKKDTLRSTGTLEEQLTFLKEEFILLKSLLLRKDANRDHAFFLTNIDNNNVNQQPDATPDARLEQEHPLFVQTFPRVVGQQLEVARVCARFYHRLQVLVKAEEETLDASSSNSSQTTKIHKQQVRQAVDDYESNLKQVFFGHKSTETSTDDEEEDSTMHQQMPHELIGFLLKDLYQKRRGSMVSTCSTASAGSLSPSAAFTGMGEDAPLPSLAVRLLGHVESLLLGDDGTTKQYSMRALQRSLLDLLRDCHDVVLDQPILVQLGYGGGDEGNNNKRQRQAEAEEDAMLRRLSGVENDLNNQGIFSVEAVDDDDDISEMGHPRDDDKDETLESPTKKMKRNGDLVAQFMEDASSSNSNDENANDKENEMKRKFVPIMWVDSSDESNQNTNDDDDWEVSPMVYSPSKQEARRLTSTSASKAALGAIGTSEPVRPLTEEEYESILEGVQTYGLGRWKMIQRNDPRNRLDHMEPNEMRDAFYQQIRPNLDGDL